MLRRPPGLLPQAALAPVLQPLPKPTSAPPNPFEPSTSLLPRKVDAPPASENLIQTGPKKETARIPILLGRSPAAAIVATSDAIDALDSMPGWFCWGLFGISALIFLIQIWDYALS